MVARNDSSPARRMAKATMAMSIRGAGYCRKRNSPSIKGPFSDDFLTPRALSLLEIIRQTRFSGDGNDPARGYITCEDDENETVSKPKIAANRKVHDRISKADGPNLHSAARKSSRPMLFRVA